MRGALCAGLLIASSLAAQDIPPLPDSSGWGVHVLALARAPDKSIWVGTYGHGMFVLRQGAGSWERIRSSSDTSAHAISWDFVHAFGFGPRGQIWYGTVGNGWGLSTLLRPEPQETPFSFIETYGPRNHSDPVYQEHFAIADVPPGEYVLGVAIGGTRVFRRVKVEVGTLTWVVFSPGPSP